MPLYRVPTQPTDRIIKVQDFLKNNKIPYSLIIADNEPFWKVSIPNFVSSEEIEKVETFLRTI